MHLKDYPLRHRTVLLRGSGHSEPEQARTFTYSRIQGWAQ
jgi:hypothetical protein